MKDFQSVMMRDKLRSLITTVPEAVEFDGTKYNPGKRDALNAWKNLGSLDILSLLIDNKITLPDTPVTNKWYKY